MRCLHIVGAGFTKGLEKRRQVPLMMDFVQVLARHARRDDICLMTLIGLERMGLFRHRIPVSRRLARAPNPKESRGQLTTNAMRRPPESIETILTRAKRVDRYLARKIRKTRRLSAKAITAIFSDPELRVQYAISSVFRTIGWQLNFGRLRRYLRSRCRPGSTHTFISFNYDLALEHALEIAAVSWSPHDGYGFRFDWVAHNDPHPNHGVPVQAYTSSVASRIIVLKPHGSLNWFVPRRREDAHMPPVLATDGAGAVRYPVTLRPHSEVRFPTFWKPIEVTPLIVPPSDTKNTSMPLLRRLRRREETALRNADEVYVLGWSMPSSDKDQIALIKRAVSARRRAFQRVVVVNRGAKENYFRRIGEVFGVPKRSVVRYNEGLQDFLLRETRRLTLV